MARHAVDPHDATDGPDNPAIAAKLRDMADLLDAQDGDRFRVAAYRRAAATIDALPVSAAEIARREGLPGLTNLPGVGTGIGSAIAEMATTGGWGALDRLTGDSAPETLFRSLPGVGPKLAARLHERLGVDTLEGLESAAHDGRLETVPGVGPRRAEAIRLALADRLGRKRLRSAQPVEPPPIGLILEIDRLYRLGASRDALPRIAPRRFNPDGAAWLPVLHEEIPPWSVTALFSNTRTAHDLGKTRDWVVLYFHKDHGPEGQCTVVTERRGPLAGRRVVRGREGATAAHYAATEGQ
ncbi:MAG: helix-hairpin-helix domain-containing protein [Alphaproteobacteria bacterium]|nr:helix-hairpin-helix domain-containing protein [Alphaproteobacteria bacterium]